MSKRGARKSGWYRREDTATRRVENRRRRAVISQLLRECMRDSEIEVDLPRFRNTEGWLTW